jgi:uncharacterized protein (DUF697 family)
MKAGDAPTDYEQDQIDQIKVWRDQPPGLVERATGIALSPVTRLVAGLVPPAAIEALLRGSDWLAEKTIRAPQPPRDDADAADLQRLDDEARAIRNWAIAYASGEGALAGAAGLLSLPIDIPAVVTLSLRTIRRIGGTYGYAAPNERERQFVYAILSVASANSMQQKQAALDTLRGAETRLLTGNLAALTERAAQRGIRAESLLLLARDVAEQLGINLTKRKLLAALPLIGAAIGATVNGWYMRDIAAAAQRAYQERWLRDRGWLHD